jgi:LysR family transcriptional regulator for metE and metH
MIEIKHFQLVQAIAEAGSMTKACQKLFLTQPSLSHQLKEIETRLGTALFLRVNKSMVLTPEGIKVLEVGKEVLSKLSTLEQEISQGDDTHRQLRITTQCYTCYHWLPTLMQKFQKIVPSTDIDIVTEAMSSPVEFLLKAQIDIAVTNQLKATNGIKFEKLFDDEQVVLVPSTHPLASKKFIDPADFSGQHYVIYKEELASDYFARNVLIPAGVQVGKVTKMQLTEARVEMVRAGMGLAVLSRWLVKPFMRDSKAIKLIPIGKKGFYRAWYLATLEQKKNDPLVKHFARFLKEQQLGTSPG